jgi:hypothetical protein
VLYYILLYTMNNITETKALIPLILTSDIIKSPTLSISINLYNYGDSCSSALLVTENSLIYQNRTTSMGFIADSSNTTCQITAEYTSIQINSNSFVDISLDESFSYAAYINFSVSSPSAVPNYNSSVSYFVSTNDKTKVFKGPQPTILTILVTPTVKNT